MNKKLIILRGLPGSGKSTYAKELANKLWEGGLACKICSADYYFERPDGVYDFNPRLLKNAHNFCEQQVKESMQTNYSIIIIDNTNTRKWEYQKYIDMANKHGYNIEEKIIGGFSEEKIKEYAGRNIHGVPYEKIKEMAERFEK